MRLILQFAILFWLVSAADAPSLRELAQRDGILMGAAVNHAYLSEPAYTATLGHEFNMVEAEDAMKWRALRPDEKSFDFTSSDRIVEFAREHGMKVRGHNLVWNQYNPEWVTHGHYSSEQLSQLLHEHIARVAAHFKGRVFAWDVVNEALDEDGRVRDSIWYNQPGIGMSGKFTAYVEQALRWAHEADPQALLFYNEAGAEEMNRKSDAVYAMAKDFKQRGVPLDGIGLQMHLLNLDVDAGSIARNISRLTGLGLQAQITELDVAVPVDAAGNPVNPDDLHRQAEIIGRIARVCLSNPGCTAIQTWGFTDKYSWINRFTRYEKGDALLFDRQYRPKEAYQALWRALLESPRRAPPSP